MKGMMMIRQWVAMSAIVVVLGGATVARGQVAVVSSKSAEGLLAGVQATLAATGSQDPQVQAIGGFLDNLKQPEMLKGIDRTKPLGAYAMIQGSDGAVEAPYAVLMVPITNQGDFLATLEQFGVQSMPPTAAVAGVTHQLTTPGAGAPPLLGRFENGYAIFTTRPKGPPTDAMLKPATVLGKPSTMLSVRMRIDQIPEPSKQQINASVDQQAAGDRAQKPGEADDDFESRMAGMNLVLDSFKALIRDGRDVVFNFDTDLKSGDLALELAAIAKPATTMATSVQAFGSALSLFQGIGSKGILNVSARVPMSEAIRKVFANQMTKGREAAAKTQGDADDKALASEFFDIFEPILTAPDFDMGLAGFGPFPAAKQGASSTYAMIFGLKVQDGAKFDKLLRDLAKKAAKDMPPGVEKITMDAAKSSDGTTAIHEIRLKPNDDPSFAIMGEPVIRIAVKRDAMLVAVGGEAPLKATLDAIGKPVATRANPPIQLSANLGKLVFLSTAMNPKAEADLREMMKANGILQGNDAARDLISLSIGGGNALTIRYKLDGAVLKMVYSLGQTR